MRKSRRTGAMTAHDFVDIAKSWAEKAKHNKRYQAAIGCSVIGLVFLVCVTKSSGPGGERDYRTEPPFTHPLPRTADDWKNLDLSGSIPEAVLARMAAVELTESTHFVMGMPVFYRQAKIPGFQHHLNVLLLHGAAFSSRTWMELHTLPVLAAMGHNVVAIDLPGGEQSLTPAVPVAPHFQKDFLEAFLDKAKMSPAVVVSPSMSGTYSLSLLRWKPERFAGFVPIAPVDKERDLTEDYLQRLQVPTLILYGDKDSRGRQVSQKLASIPTSALVEVPEATHPAYIDQPDFFHDVLYNFLRLVTAIRAGNV